jgi:hypothetical protein
VSTIQQELNDFLQCELYHTLGSYGTTVQCLKELAARVARMKRRDSDTDFDTVFPNDVVTLTRRYNELLRTSLHRPAGSGDEYNPLISNARHPQPGKRLDGGDVRDRWVLDFYATASAALTAAQAAETGSAPDVPKALLKFGQILAIVHDPQRRGADIGMPIPGRIERSNHRLSLAQDLLEQDRGRDRSSEIIDDCLTSPRQDQLHTHAVGALVDAHICMHHAEHLMAKTFGEKIEHRREFDTTIECELRRSLMLNTFVYVVGRATPWIFSADPEERDFVVDHYPECCNRLSPTYCMWIGSQLSLLALHRRAYTYHLMGKPEKSYNDFHKLRRFIRNLKRQLGRSIAEAPGADTFLIGLDAFADHHSGRIYRSQHAHTTALRHFDRAVSRLATLEGDPGLLEMLRNSRWRIDLLMSQAKANYELGLVKACLLCYARAWRSFLELADTESLARANFTIVDEVIGWLRQVEADTDIDKVELKRNFEPLVEQFRMLRGPIHLRILAAEIMLRVGHLLFILRLPQLEEDRVVTGDEETHETDQRDVDDMLAIEVPDARYPIVDHRLAHRCLIQAALLDPASTLIAADLRKFDYWRDRLDIDPLTNAPVEPPPTVEIGAQWPGGNGDFEDAARIVEYLLQCWLSETYTINSAPAHERIARRLLAAFLAHTESSNVKLAQVYRYLMQESTFDRRLASTTSTDPPSIELTCLRRYSSFFPFIPRPSAFRVLGGGYFARIEESTSEDGRIFGVVIDPGPDFISNLYRCGYCLDDVHMVVVTHDHADHIAALDALLALLGYRQMYGVDTFTDHKLAIIGNASVHRRYSFYNKSTRDKVSVWSFEEWERATITEPGWVRGAKRLREVNTCASLRLERVETVEHRDAGGNVAQGFLLKTTSDGSGATILFTSDTGKAPSLSSTPAETQPDVKTLKTALAEADVVIAHVSSVPLSELRELAGFSAVPEAVLEQTNNFQALWSHLQREIETAPEGDDWTRRPRFLLRQLQFGFHSRPIAELEKSETKGLEVSPLSASSEIRSPSERHLYLSGLLPIAENMKHLHRPQLLLIGELREELGTFRTRIAGALNTDIFKDSTTTALTTDIGLKVRIQPNQISVLCTTCDLDNDLVDSERFHEPSSITEVCVKGENEGIFYNCSVHEPLMQPHPVWIERIERYDPFGR